MSDNFPPPTLTIELAKPVNFDGREYVQLILREPTAKEVLSALEHIRNGQNGHSVRNMEMHLVAKAAGVPLPVIEQIPISALFRAMEYISTFLAGSPTI
ncbi:phage tail assembly protein [Rhodopila sp.]|uniref:phage tail assembly protein n=1 Tax=Rhodopila sp. TaxID=2480087 RepID=UPI003D11566B